MINVANTYNMHLHYINIVYTTLKLPIFDL